MNKLNGWLLKSEMNDYVLRNKILNKKDLEHIILDDLTQDHIIQIKIKLKNFKLPVSL